jgi:hypothetical protein
MKKGIIILCSSALVLFNACKKDIANPDTFTFGRFCGFCMGDCATVFKLEQNQLFADDMTESIHTTPLRFKTAPLSDDKRLIAKQLADAMPAQLLNETAETIGCPGCWDQCGYLIVWNQNGVSKQWYLDSAEGSVPAYLKPFVVKIHETFTKLQ